MVFSVLSPEELKVAGSYARLSCWCGVWGLLIVLSSFGVGDTLASNLEELEQESPMDRWVIEIAGAAPEVVSALVESYDVLEAGNRAGVVTVLVSTEELDQIRQGELEFRVDWDRTYQANQQRDLFLHRSHPSDGFSNDGASIQGGGIPGFPCYRTVEETFEDLEQLSSKHPNLASWIDVGDSWEKINGPADGYDIFDLVISNSASDAEKAPFFLLASIHARELTTAELAARFAEWLLEGYGVDPDATWLLDHREIHIVAQGNPDGRKRAETGISWRKNANNEFCSDDNQRGIDLNRNSTFRWSTAGSSSNECSNTFHGPGAGSEPETQSVEALMATIFEDQRGPRDSDAAPLDATGLFVSLHSFGEWVVFPWDGLPAETPNFSELQTLGRKFGFFNGYKVCQTANCLNPAAGSTSGVSYGEYGVATYTFELGTWFFEDCSVFDDDILPDNLPALIYAAKSARRPYQEPSGPDVVALALGAASAPQGRMVPLRATVDDTRFASGGFGDEPTHTIESASYSIDVPPWLASEVFSLSPIDGDFDLGVEDVFGKVDTSNLETGRHLIYVFGTDSSGRQGVPTAIFLEVTEPSEGDLFFDGFESGDTRFWTTSIGE